MADEVLEKGLECLICVSNKRSIVEQSLWIFLGETVHAVCHKIHVHTYLAIAHDKGIIVKRLHDIAGESS